jgi:hypothetical protein
VEAVILGSLFWSAGHCASQVYSQVCNCKEGEMLSVHKSVSNVGSQRLGALYGNAPFYWSLLLQQHLTMGMLPCCFCANCACDIHFHLWLKDQLKALEFMHRLKIQVTSKIAL